MTLARDNANYATTGVTVAELDVLDGITATTAELNYTDGVTSALQTQMNLKAPLAAPAFTGTATGANLTLSGDLTVNGSTVTLNTTNSVITDNLIELNNTATSNANDSGIVIERGSTGDNAFMGWDESADKFIVGTTTATGANTGDLTIATGTLVANIEGNVTGNVTGNTSGTAATVTGAAQTNITSVGTLTSLTVSGTLNVAADTNESAQIGRVHIGHMGWSDYASFSHVDRDSATGFAVNQSSSGATFINSEAGQNINLGIGGISGKMIIYSDSSANIPGAGGTSNTVLGQLAGSNLVAGANENVFIGYGIGTGSTIDSGCDSNVFVGYKVGMYTTAANNNAAVGHESLFYNQTGVNNAAVGYGSARGTTYASHSNSAALGSYALGKIQTGADNVAVGFEAVYYTTTGDNNIGIGYKALRGNETGDNNIAIGYQAMDNPSNYGTDNIFIGKDCGGGSWSGNASETNTAIGHGAMTNNMNNCHGNTVVGYQSGTNIVGGDFNIIIGYGSGTVSDGSTCITIGKQISANANEVRIGKASNVIYSLFTGSPNWQYSSDLRKKQDIKDDTLGLSFIDDLKTKTFRWKPAEEHPEEWEAWETNKDGEREYHEMDTETVMHGMIAQDVKEALDTAGVSTFGGWSVQKDGQQSLAPAAFVMPLIKAVQELSAKVTALENA